MSTPRLTSVPSLTAIAPINRRAFLKTSALAAAASDKIAAAAITSGGVQTAKGSTAAAPTMNVAAQVRVPFLILQGAKDTTVPPESSELFKWVLDKNKVPNERHVFDGVGHSVPTERTDEVNRLMRDWLTKNGVVRSPEKREPKP